MNDKDLFWPPIRGGWESYSGILIQMEDVVSEFAGAGFEIPDYAKIGPQDDESDIWGVLCDLADAAKVPGPEHVFYFIENDPDVRNTGKPIRQGFYAFWPLEVWRSSGKLQKIIGEDNPPKPIEFEYKHSRWLPAGEEFILFLAAFIALLLVFTIWKR